MLFNSWIFAVYLPVVVLLYYGLDRRRQNIFLLAASYFFYGWWDYRFCSLLAISTIIDYCCGLQMQRSQAPLRRKLLLAVSCFCNLGMLGFFKYFNFFAGSAEGVLRALGVQPDMPTLNIVLPVGISFYTFQTLSYTIDIYRRQLEPTRNFIDFALFVSFFPQLVAGPIERARRLLPQIQAKRSVTWDHITSGCLLILLGLFRKIAIADGVAPTVNEIFSNPAQSGSLELLIGVYLFSIQIYCDFAGYSDIARGTARLLGIELMENFQHPYFSTNITEFWHRWHISLSTWLRDYLYIPLGGNRNGTLATYRNLLLTMLLGGLWHGASWTFVVWGGLHGVYLTLHKLMLGGLKAVVDNRSPTLRQWPMTLVKMFVTLHLVGLAWIFFRAPDFHTAWVYVSGLAACSSGWPAHALVLLVVSCLLLLLVDIPQYIYRRHEFALSLWWPVRAAFYVLLILAMFVLRSDGEIPFIYFQF